MVTIGCHLSSAKGYLAMGETARSIGANTFQFFTRNPRGSRAKERDPADEAAFPDFWKQVGGQTILAHAPYTLNPCAARVEVLDFARTVLSEDLMRLEALPGTLYNFHPGSHVGQGFEKAVALLTGLLNELISPKQHTVVLLETMAGKGTEVGGRFEELREILDRVTCGDKMGVCFDTCHVFDAGYDIVGDLDGVLTEFDRVVGLDKLRAIHLNDSMNPLGSRKDRHQKLDEGSLGLDAVKRIVTHPALKDLPFFLETPNDLPGYAREIALVKALAAEE